MTPKEFLEKYATRFHGGYLLPEPLKEEFLILVESVRVPTVLVINPDFTDEDFEKMKRDMQEAFSKVRPTTIRRAGDMPVSGERIAAELQYAPPIAEYPYEPIGMCSRWVQLQIEFGGQNIARWVEPTSGESDWEFKHRVVDANGKTFRYWRQFYLGWTELPEPIVHTDYL